MKKEKDRIIWKSLMMVTQVGISMLAPIFLCVVIGIKLDQWLSTGHWFIVFLILGVLSAFRSAYTLLKRFYAKDLEREKKEQQYFDDLTRERKNKNDR